MIRRGLCVMLMVGQAGLVAAADIPVSAGELLRVSVYGRPELSGDYPVQAGGDLALPLIGRVMAAGQPPAALEALIETRLLDRQLDTQPDVAVTVLRYRDVYVTGGVAAPGAFAWTPGLTVAQAVALAGSRSLVAADEVAPALQAVRAREYLAATQARLDVLRTREQRLRAELAEVRQGYDPASAAQPLPEAALPPPPALEFAPALAANAGMEPVRAAQAELYAENLTFNRASFRALLLRRAALIEKRMALETRSSGLTAETGLIRDQLKTSEGLLNSGLARRAEVLELRRTLAATEGVQIEVLIALKDTDLALAENALAIETFRTTQVRSLTATLDTVLEEIADLTARLGPAREAAELAASFQPGRLAAEVSVVTVIRSVEGAALPMQLGENDPLLPGDVLQVPVISLD